MFQEIKIERYTVQPKNTSFSYPKFCHNIILDIKKIIGPKIKKPNWYKKYRSLRPTIKN